MISTPFMKAFGVACPVVLAPMGGVAGGRLAAAVSNAGGLGMVGGGYWDPRWLETELAIVASSTDKPWGAGLITWSMTPGVLRQVLDAQPTALMLSFGDPRPHADVIKAAGCKLICQVQDLEGARWALEAGADLVVAQGTEAGGHGGSRGTLALVPTVVDLAGSVPVLAAGGVADGRGLAAALMLGAQGVLVGTRFYASTEALGHEQAKARLVQSGGDHTVRTRVFDIVRGYDWPNGYTGRALRNAFTQRWHNDEAQLMAQQGVEAASFWTAVQEGDYDTAMVWASEAVDLINEVADAATILHSFMEEAQAALRRAPAYLS